MYYFNNILSIFILLSVMPYVFSITCFICSSDTDPLCADPFNNSSTPLSDCKFMRNPHREVLPAVCRKVKQRVNNTWLITRDCAYVGDVLPSNGEEIHCVTSTGSDNILTEYCTCINKRGCNSF